MQIDLHVLTNDFKNAGLTWVQLCSIYPFRDYPYDAVASFFGIEGSLFADEGNAEILKNAYPYDLLVDLLEIYPAIGQEIIDVNRPNLQMQLGQAYAYYRLNKVKTALQLLGSFIFLKIPPLFKKDDFDWLYKLSKTNFIAAVIYSSIYKSSEGLETYYHKMLTYHPSKHFFVYHNLAVRLFFQKHYQAALNAIQKAIKSDRNDGEAQRMLGLIYDKLEFEENSQEAHDEANALDPALNSCNRNYRQADLLYFPVEKF